MTYSIVARDPATGELGVAVQSHWFSVGPIVPWAQAGVGAVATQANVQPSYGPRALDLMRSGASSGEALAQLVEEDSGSAGRQVAVIDAVGRLAVHTGSSAIPFAGHVTGDQVSCQANMMASETVWPAMIETYQQTGGSLTRRLLAVLDAAEREGGDVRGRQSAAILVVPGSGDAWQSVVSLRVEDHPEPLVELRRLVDLHDAYALASEADDCINEGRHDDAARLFERARALAPGNHELMFWAGLGAAHAGDIDRGVQDVRAAIELQPGWGELLERMPPEVAPSARAVAQRLRDSA
jgi:uncharacterized Ntn-hydrolase superfamily protein